VTKLFLVMPTSPPRPPTGPIAEPVDFRLDEELFAPSGIVLTIAGELDIATVPHLRERLGAALRGGVRSVVIDLRPLFFLDSIAVAALLQGARQLGEGGRLAVVVAPDSYIRMVFEIAGLPHCLDVVETLEDAVAQVSG
jgi:anti-sigma B factor antagonist